YGPSFEFDYQKAFQNIQQLVLRYPNSAEGYATLAHLAMYVGDTKLALEASQRSLEIDSVYAGTVFNNMGYALALSGNAVEAMKYFHKSKAIRPTYYAIDGYIAQCYWVKEQYDSVDQCLQSILPVADNRRKIITYSQLASLYYYRGQLQKADNVCRDAIAFCQTVKRTGDEAYFHYLLGEIANDLENSDIYKTEMRRAEQLSASPFPELPLIRASYARTGRLKEADRIMKHISELKSADPYFVKRRNDFIHFIKGEILFAEHVPDKAMKEFMMIEKIHSADPYYLLAQKGIAWCQTERSDTATIRMLTNILERKGEIIFGFVLAIRNSGFWIRSLLPEIHLEIGKIYIRQNNLEAAKLHLRICLNCWQDADEKFQKVKEAQKLLTQLTKEK
ncbi:MAG: hypothetical protein C0417_01995, partial [Chlorobiaceae bacterium]|nr:hypothetical protein [Chlorobiaceae bacterium]